MPADLPRTTWLSVVGWACYLACSWTWCIGMFLPALLVRDYGVWGFIVFAVPNVLGAAAMGWVFRTRTASRRLVEEHSVGIAAFTVVTVLFHFYWLAWVRTLGGAGTGLLLSTLVLVLAFQSSGERAGPRTAWAAGRWVCTALALGISAAAAVALNSDGSLRPPTGPGAMSAADLLMVAPVCIFGFALCPYLDATFHRAREAMTLPQSRWAFGVGFGIIFFAMILLTLAYSGTVLRTLGRTDGSREAIEMHFNGQSVFTCGVHLLACAALLRPSRRRGGAAGLSALLLAIAATVGLGAAAVVTRLPGHAGLAAGEVGYRVIMAFYGLVFPAYVWLCVIPTGEGHSGLGGRLGRRKLVVWMASVAIAAPMFWVGFIERQEVWLAPGLGVVLIARLCVMRRGSGVGR